MILSQTGMLSVGALIGLTFLGGIGAALMGPTWQAIVPELVKREDVKSAVALNSLGINIARSIGPAAGGLLLAAFGAGITYGADVASYGVAIAALLWWPRAKNINDELQENFFGAFRARLRYTRSSTARLSRSPPELQATNRPIRTLCGDIARELASTMPARARKGRVDTRNSRMLNKIREQANKQKSCQSWLEARHCQPVRNATLALTISPRSGRLGRVERAERGRVITFPFGFSFLTELSEAHPQVL
ncbi:MFS family permease [Rhizobium mesoamericanum]|nr:MFS family permease [Rhizobium mesoamericanum]